MSYNFLDKTGLTHLWDKIKSYIIKKTIPLIEGTQTANTSAWTGVAPFSELTDGQVINFYLPFSSTNTAVTLNLTLSDSTTTGALPVYYNNGTERMTTHFGRGNVVGLMYRTSRVNSSGTTITNSWLHISDRDTTDVQILRFENGSMIAGINGVINYGLCAVDNVGRYQSFVTTNGTGTSKTINTSAKFRNPMVMCRNTANTKYTNGQEVGTGYNSYYVQRFDARYSCNGYENFVKNMPTYLECTKDSDGYLSVTSNVLTQTFQSGKYYVYVGHSCRDYAYYIQLQPWHPTYYYNGTNLIPEEELKADKTSIPTKVSDLTNDSGFTTNTGTVTSVAVKMNNATKGTVTTSGTIDLGTVITSHQSLADRAVNKTLTNENLNNVTTPGFYNAGGGNSVTNKPSGIDHFGLYVVHGATGSYYTQRIFNDSTQYRRKCVNGTWGSWSEDKLTDTTYSSKTAASGGTDVSLVTTGEKYTWNNKTSNTGTVTSVAVKMNGSTKGTVTTSGTIDLGTVITNISTMTNNDLYNLLNNLFQTIS